MDRFDPMAGHGSDGYRGVDGGVAAKVETKLWLLAVSIEQPSVDHLGRLCSRPSLDRSAVVAGCHEYPRSI